MVRQGNIFVGLIVALFLVLLTLSPIMAATSDEIGTDAPSTTLLVTLDTVGDYHHSGDTFKLKVIVKNIGSAASENTAVKLQDIPEGWTISPYPTRVPLGQLLPGESKRVQFDVTRDATEATIYAVAGAHNSPNVSSNIIPIPISPIVLVLFALTALVITFLSNKR